MARSLSLVAASPNFASEPDATLVHSFCRRVAAGGSRPAVVFHNGRQFGHVDWRGLADLVRRTAVALARAGCRPGDRVVQSSENRLEWLVTDLAILMAGGVHVPLHATLSAEQAVGQVRDCGARIAVVSAQHQADKFAGLSVERADGFVLFSHDRCSSPWTPGVDLPRLADAATDVASSEAERIAAESLHRARSGDLATILYTSGTTGEPKGVMLSHGNLVFNAQASLEAFSFDESDLRLSLLPWSHIFARTCDLYTALIAGSMLAIAENRERVMSDCAELRPTLLNAVPYFFERVYRRAAEADKVEQAGYLREALGGRIRLCCSGGAALPRYIAEWFASQGVPLVEGYGLSETSPVITAASPENYRIGTVGRALRGVEVRIADDGEILTRGPHVMLGYFGNPAATAEVIRDGWFATGDLGQLDADGYLTITGRKKELIVTAAGKNIAPTMIEALLAADPLIHQAVVFGDGHNYLVALVVPSPEALRAEIFRRRITIASKEEALTHPEVQQLYAERISERLAGLSRHEQIVRFRLLDRALTQEADELTPTLKLRREVIQSHFAAELAELYGESA